MSGLFLGNVSVQLLDPMTQYNTYEFLDCSLGYTNISTTKAVSLLWNPTGVSKHFALGHAQDGTLKRLVNGLNGGTRNGQSTSFIFVDCSNNLSNDMLDLSVNTSADLVYVGDLSGWVCINTCSNISGFWD